MSDLKKYVSKRKKKDSEFSEGFERGYENFKIGVMLRQARKDAGMTQEDIAELLGTKKTAISRLENHAEDMRLSTIENYAKAVGKSLSIKIA